MTDLREALGARDPEFDLALPPGWARHETTEAARDALIQQVRQRLMQTHRPDLMGQLQRMLHEAWDGMRRTDTFAWFGPAEDDESTAWWPASMTASILRGPDGGTLDPVVVDAIRTRGATALFEDKRFIRFETSSTQVIGGEQLGLTTITYITPMPGSRRRRGLHLTATIMTPPHTPQDDEPLELMRTAFDLCVSTLTWRRP